MPASPSGRKYISAKEEVETLPPGWKHRVRSDEKNRVSFYDADKAQAKRTEWWDHPLFGSLPKPWELRWDVVDAKYVYYDPETKEREEDGPRKVLKPPKPPTPPPGSIRIRPTGMGKLLRQEISKTPLNDEYPRVLTIDDGSGDLGGMNGGIYVVRGRTTGQLYVEKSYKATEPHIVRLIKHEIAMMRALLHSAIIHYVAGYVCEKPSFAATVYMEFCDRGSLKDLLRAYKRRKKAHRRDWVPESFVWHALVSLADALAYLQTGRSFACRALGPGDAPRKWRAVLHRDIKPDNVFLRSRDTPGSKKPFYVLLSDFGLMSWADEDGKRAGKGPLSMAGTPEYQAPELAFDPCPAPHQTALMAAPHSPRSDVWAVACMMYCMCERDDLAHMDRNTFPIRSQRALGRTAKRPDLLISPIGFYSDYLARTIQWAGERDPDNRPDGEEFVKEALAQAELWQNDPNWKKQVDVKGVLPAWATKKMKV
ncbi:protein kinase-like domain-containing protein [Xylariomycetidae sp. FL0641]|nr:protein kinase-like domain-containing protein [Xylariomycetidae sp. FL0641]